MSWQNKEGRVVKVGFASANWGVVDIAPSPTQVYNLDKQTVPVTRLPGVWAYEVARQTTSVQKCQRYTCGHSALLTNTKFQSDVNQLYQCPCTLNLVDRRWWLFDYRGDIYCYALSPLVKSRLLLGNTANRLCCYQWNATYVNQQQYEESLRRASHIHNSPDAGHALVGDAWRPYADYQIARETMDAHRWCCKESGSGTLCDRFYSLFRDAQCTNVIPYIPSYLLGDPHFITLDKVNFTMNAHAELILMNVSSMNFMLQARTDRAEDRNGSKINATVFTAFAAREGHNPSFQVKLSPNKTSMVITANNEDISSDFYRLSNYSLVTDSVGVRRENTLNKTSLVVNFPVGVTIIVQVGVRGLEIDLEVDKSLQSKTNGLLGNFNGNPDDDFELPNGTVLPKNITERDILYKFAAMYRVNQDNSVFIYEPGKSTDDYQHPEFVPAFQDNLNQAKVNEAAVICGGAGNKECIYDYVVTGDPAVALATKARKDEILSRQNILSNTPPTVEISANKLTNGRWLVRENSMNILPLLTMDADRDNVTLNSLTNNSNVVLLSNGSVQFIPSRNSPVRLSFQARDSKGTYSSILNIPVTVCPSCSGHGVCDSNSSLQLEYLDGMFQIQRCLCQPAYTGANCESELDACASQPCSRGQNCTDLTAAQQGNSTEGHVCGPCPPGFMKLNKICVDFNECLNTSVCEQICVNTEGSYKCQCNEGYTLSSTNFRTCSSQQCNRTLTNSNGVIMSPNYPLNYDHDTYCTWTILSNQTGATITVNISTYQVEGCPYDYLTMYDGNSANASKINTYCNTAPGIVTSTGPAMHLVFVSDNFDSSSGFIGTYSVQNTCRLKNCSHSCQVVSSNPRVEQCVCPEWARLDPNNSSRCIEINACNSTVTASSGYIVSPGYPNNYADNLTCYWNIATTLGKQITFTFYDMNVEQNALCSYDYVKVLDGSSAVSRSLGQFCGDSLPVVLRSSGQNLYVLFKSDESVHARGFKAQFTTL